jgi:hypothetical protein
MFASLVVCLPFEHGGGELHIRHGSVTSVIDWSSKSGSVIQWVALYSNCEHEVRASSRRAAALPGCFLSSLDRTETGARESLFLTIVTLCLLKSTRFQLQDPPSMRL